MSVVKKLKTCSNGWATNRMGSVSVILYGIYYTAKHNISWCVRFDWIKSLCREYKWTSQSVNRHRETFLTVHLRNYERISLDQTAGSRWVVCSSGEGHSLKERWAGDRKFGGVDWSYVFQEFHVIYFPLCKSQELCEGKGNIFSVLSMKAYVWVYV